MGDTIALYLLSRFYPMLKGMGVNTVQLNKIVETRLKIDGRRPPFMLQQSGPGRERNSVVTVVLTLVFGALYGSILFAIPDKLLGLTVYFAFFMILITLSLVADFSSVLFDTRDQFIIAPKPVDDRTYAVSKIAHTAIYVLRLALIQSAPALVIIGFIDGVAAIPVFLLQVIEATLMCVILVNLIYLLLMNSVDQQNLKDIIGYFQVGISILTFTSYYLVPRLLKLAQTYRFNLVDQTWSWSLPSLWVASLNAVIVHPGSMTRQKIGLALLGIAFAFGGLWLFVNIFAPGFNRRLSALASSEGESSRTEAGNAGRFAGRIVLLGRRLTSSHEELAGFIITSKLMFRSRDFMMKVLPVFAFVPVYFSTMVMKNIEHGPRTQLDLLYENHQYVLLYYMTFMAFSGIIQHVSYSEKYKAAWIYYVSPIQVPGRIQAGMFKGMIAMVFMPFFLVVTAVSLFVWGPGILGDACLAFCNCLIFGLVLTLIMLNGFPFSKPISLIHSGGRVYLTLIPVLVLMAIAFGHVTIASFKFVVGVLASLSFSIYLVLMAYYKKQSWAHIKSTDYY